MIIDMDFKPTPSDFGNFVFCREKWFLGYEKPLVKKLDNEKDPLFQGKKNEHKCIEWVCNNIRIAEKQILFDGTGKDNHNFLTSEMESVSMRCQPDLIINKDGQNLLFEFKAVSEPRYLDLDEFDSVHAQVWCYTKLKEIRINEFYLLRYFIDPCYPFAWPSPRRYTSKTYSLKELKINELAHSKFERIFKDYIKLIDLLKLKDSEIKELILTKPNYKELIQNISKHPNSKDIKCPNCIRRKKGYCHLNKP